jgi:hypothetical protein
MTPVLNRTPRTLLLFLFKYLSCYTKGQESEPEPPEPEQHQNCYIEAPHKNYAARNTGTGFYYQHIRK